MTERFLVISTHALTEGDVRPGGIVAFITSISTHALTEGDVRAPQ